MNRPHCATCSFYLPPKQPVPGADIARDVFHIGVCKRYPAAVSKQPSDWCGEHKEMQE